LTLGGGERVRGALAVDDTGVRAAALGLGPHLLGRLDADDARVEWIGQHRGEASGTGAEIEDRQTRAHAAEVAGERVHPQPAGVAGERAAGPIRAMEPPIVVDAGYHKASGSGSPLNASVGIGTGGMIPRRSHRT